MPLLMRLRITATNDAKLPADPGQQGQCVHAGFLALVARHDRLLSHRLHGLSSHRALPFTLSTLLDADDAQRQVLHVVSGLQYVLQITSLDEVFSGWMQETLRIGGLPIHIGGARFETAAVCDEIRHETYEEILAAPAGGREMAVCFLSPTTFRSGRRNWIFPHPSMVFRGLLEKWDKWAGQPEALHRFAAGPDQAAVFDDVLDVSRYDLRTRLLIFKGRTKQVGFLGTCAFRHAKGADPAITAVAWTLGRFAPYAGVGSKTTMGMGRVGVSFA